MKKATFCFIVCVLLLSCAAGLMKKDTDAWLATKATPSQLNLTGKWDAGNAFS